MVPIAVLSKEGPLDDAEWALLRRYPEHGALLIATTPSFERFAAPVRAGNERWDGGGYPDGLAGEAIPAASRITYVAQAYLAMRADRPYRPAVTRAEAIVGIAGAAGAQFDPRAVTALVELLIDEPSEQAAPDPSAADAGLDGGCRAKGGSSDAVKTMG
jgi:HD-GYP domain-containing protein (c-di-GMP phosphodiesterase class II)